MRLEASITHPSAFLKIVCLMAMQVINLSIDKLSVRDQITMLEKVLCPLREANGFFGAPPAYPVNHGNHWTRYRGVIGHSPMPEANVSNQDTAALHAGLQRWSNRTLFCLLLFLHFD